MRWTRNFLALSGVGALTWVGCGGESSEVANPRSSAGAGMSATGGSSAGAGAPQGGTAGDAIAAGGVVGRPGAGGTAGRPDRSGGTAGRVSGGTAGREIGGAAGVAVVACEDADVDIIGAACTVEGDRCDIREQCCCGMCWPELECRCDEGRWACAYNDACLDPGCAGEGGWGGQR